MAADSGEKTEQATEKRMKEVRKRGELTSSKDLPAWLAVAAVIASMPGLISSAESAGRNEMATIVAVIAHPSAGRAVQALGDGLGSILSTVGPMFAAVILAVIGGAALQGGFHFKHLKVSFKNFDLLTGLKRTFGTQALWEGAKALLKTFVLGFVLITVIQGLVPQLMASGGLPLEQLVSAGQASVGAVITAAVAAGLAIAGLDMIVVMRRNLKKSRMTKKEVKDESKSTEGDPLIRGQRRQRAFAMSRGRMLAAVADADVVMLNPTHIAVALKYEPGKAAPRVVAKGGDEVAARIRERAAEHRIPMVHDVPLARALHAACEIGDEIPEEFYGAVARVLAFVFSLKARGGGHGIHTLTAATR